MPGLKSFGHPLPFILDALMQYHSNYLFIFIILLRNKALAPTIKSPSFRSINED
jgi:hypothetical protein